MSRWIAMHCGDEIDSLQENYPNAFLLVCQIARRARWKRCEITGLSEGEAWIGDWKVAGLHSRKAYEIAKKRLEKCGLVRFEGRNKGTVARLVDSRIFSLTAETRGEQEAHQGGIKGASKAHQGGTIHTEKKEILNTQSESEDTLARGEHSLVSRIKGLRSAWEKPTLLTAKERPIFEANRELFESFTVEDWNTQRAYLAARLKDGDPGWQPKSLIQYLDNPSDVMAHAAQWKSKQRAPAIQQPKPLPPASEEDKAALAEFLKSGILKANIP